MGNPFGSRADESLENESCAISAYFKLDGSSNVIGFAPTASPPTLVGPYSRAKGMQKSLGPAGAVIVQPHASVGVYLFTLDEPWFAATELWVQLQDQGAIVALNYALDCNVGANTLGGAWPGNDPTITPQTIRLRFRNSTTGALTDPAANTGFWLGCKIKRTGV